MHWEFKIGHLVAAEFCLLSPLIFLPRYPATWPRMKQVIQVGYGLYHIYHIPGGDGGRSHNETLVRVSSHGLELAANSCNNRNNRLQDSYAGVIGFLSVSVLYSVLRIELDDCRASLWSRCGAGWTWSEAAHDVKPKKQRCMKVTKKGETRNTKRPPSFTDPAIIIVMVLTEEQKVDPAQALLEWMILRILRLSAVTMRCTPYFIPESFASPLLIHWDHDIPTYSVHNTSSSHRASRS